MRIESIHHPGTMYIISHSLLLLIFYVLLLLLSPALVCRLIDIGVTQIIDAKRAKAVEDIIAAAQSYVNAASKDEKLKPLMNMCKNNHENCAYWAVLVCFTVLAFEYGIHCFVGRTSHH